MLLLPENFLDDETGCDPDCTSSSPLSGGTERMLWKLLGERGYLGDCGGARPAPRSEFNDRCDRCESFVLVRGCEEMVSMLFVRLGTCGDGACTFTTLPVSTASGLAARRELPK
jgi:hypothetical protein